MADRITEMVVFSSVYGKGGVTEAAKALGISKSAVSKHITSLEARLDKPLFHRTTRRVNPTEFGDAYYVKVQRVLHEFQDVEVWARASQKAPAGNLRVCVDADFGRHCLEPYIAEFTDKYPEITLNISLCDKPSTSMLRNHDVVMLLGELHDSTMQMRKVARVERFLLASPKYLREKGYLRKIEDLNSHQLLRFGQTVSEGAWNITSPSGETRQIRVEAALTMNDGQALLNACLAGKGIAFLPSFICQKALESKELGKAMPSLPEQVEDVYLVRNPGKFVEPKVTAFADFVGKRFGGRSL